MRKDRIYILDWLRGIAVLGMVLHHGLFAVEAVSDMFGMPIVFEILQTKLFWVLQELFVGLFLLISGICTAYSRSVLRRGLIVTAAALAVSAVTCLLLPALGIYGLEIRFGILHMFGLSMLLYGLFTCKKRWIPALTGAVLFCLWLAVVVCPGSAYSETVLIAVGITPDGFYSADYYPLLPYFFLYLAGTFIGPAVKEGKFPRWFYAARLKPIEWVGRNSLLIYLLHQVILFGIIYGIFTLITL